MKNMYDPYLSGSTVYFVWDLVGNPKTGFLMMRFIYELGQEKGAVSKHKQQKSRLASPSA